MSEPRTEAGRRLLAREAYNSRSFALITIDDILAIEAEAATPDPRVERLEAAARAFVDVASEQYTVGDKTWPHRYDDAREALRALLRSPQERSGE